MKCALKEQGLERGACLTKTPEGSKVACQATLKQQDGMFSRLIRSMHLSRPEDYFSIYTSGCNHSCLFCHSSEFSKEASGDWYSTEALAEQTADYAKQITVMEPKERVTMFHANNLCRHCGSCVSYGLRHPFCPQKLRPEQVRLSVQGWGPARNIAAFTGGDLLCQPGYYVEATEKIKETSSNRLHVLLETNGYALTPINLETLSSGGIDGFWLDIKAYDEDVYRRLCGTSNRSILDSVPQIVDLGFTLEVLTLYIPDWVETDQHVQIAELIASIDPSMPTTLLAYFPAYKLSIRRPNLVEMMRSYAAMKNVGLKQVRMGNIGVFARTQEDTNLLVSVFGREVLG
ncbi:MAG: radical SAM protein [Candidatus Hermodarchaeota archaeon]